MQNRNMPNDIPNWIKRTNTLSEYCVYTPDAFKYKGYDEPDWQFRISILPRKENLNKAVQALAKVFSDPKYSDIEFKCFVLNSNEEGALKEWNTIDGGSDRSHRGKEICVYMHLLLDKDNKNRKTFEANKESRDVKYQRSPDEWKQLMLSCWKALLDERVEGIGYAACPSGDKQVASEIGLTIPFTYTSFKPYDQPHGILFETNYNPNKYKDPLEGMVIRREDLNKFNIPLSHTYDMYQSRINYTASYIDIDTDSLQENLKNLLKQMQNNNTPSINDLISKAKEEIRANNHAEDKTINALVKSIPLTGKKALGPSNLAGGIENYHKRGMKDRLLEALDQAYNYSNQQRNKELEDIYQDYNNHGTSAELLTWEINVGNNNVKIDEKTIKDLINYNPGEMQNIIFRGISHLLHEKNALAKLMLQKPIEFSEINQLIDIIQDTPYWRTKSQVTSGVPDGVGKMQQAFAKTKGVETTPLNPKELTNIYKDLFVKFKMIAEEKVVNRSTSSSFLKGSSRRSEQTKNLYDIFSETKGEFTNLHLSPAFNNILDDWNSYHQNQQEPSRGLKI